MCENTQKEFQWSKRRKLAAAVILSLLLALSGTMPAFAAEEPAEKDEVVYADLRDDGQVDRIYVVNIFEGQKNILDYGNYESVRNMTSTDEIRQNGDRIRIATDEESLYYQGNLSGGEIPWRIRLSYYLDGEERTPAELAGKSGQMKMRIRVTENPDAQKSLFQNYALQITAAMDTKKCKKIVTKDATEANAGGDRQLTWTLLPGTEKTIEVSAAVNDFEMESISFNGIRLNMDVNVDSREITKKFDSLSTAVKRIDAGAKALSSGARQLDSGAKKLDKGVDSLEEKVKKLEKQSKKSKKLATASTDMKSALKALDQGIEKAKQAVSYDAYKQAMAQNGLNIDELKAGNAQLLTLLEQMEKAFTDDQKVKYGAQLAQAKNVLKGNSAAIEGTEQYLSRAGQGLSEVESGSGALKDSYDSFDIGVQSMVKQLNSLDLSQISQLTKGAESLAAASGQAESGSGRLADGTGRLNQKTSGMSAQLTEEVDRMLEGISGSSQKVKSFVSKKNTNVKAVQFVIKNDPVEIPEKQPPAESTEQNLSWWQKLLDLFGLS